MWPFLEKYFSTIKSILPEKSVEPSIGLDIGTTECKFIQIQKTAQTYEWMSLAIEPINKDDVVGAVKRGLHQLGAGHSKSVYTSLFGRGTLIRHINFPRMSLEDLKNSFAIEADKYFPFPQDQIYTDCCILDPQGKGKQMSVMAAAAKRDLVNGRLKLLRDLGLQVNGIVLNPVALANVVNVLGWENNFEASKSIKASESSELVAIFDMGNSLSNLSLIRDRQLCFTRDIYIGGKDLTVSLVTATGVGVKEAEELKCDPGARQAEVMAAYESVLMNMAQEIHLSFDYYTTEKGGEVKRLFLTGGGANVPGLAEALSKMIDIEVKCWNPLQMLKSSTSSVETLDKQSMRMGAALGLALYHYD